MTTMSKINTPTVERELNKLDELNDEQLDKMTGGDAKVPVKSSPNLYTACCTGVHVAKVVIEL
jgi:hypothetical protein